MKQWPLAMTLLLAGCPLVPEAPDAASRALETRFSFANLSTRHYAAAAVRRSGTADAFVKTPLLAPGVIHRADFRDLIGIGCPDAIDLQIFIYRRMMEDTPIGLDPTESVETTPIVAGTVSDLGVCRIEPLVTYTVINRESDDTTASLKVAQESAAARDLFVEGVHEPLADAAPPALADPAPISGRVTLADGAGVADVGVLLRTFFRVRDTDADTANDPDSGFSEPIAFTTSDAQGRFQFERPAGGYQVEFFSDDFTFRPATLAVESPIENIQVIVEPVE